MVKATFFSGLNPNWESREAECKTVIKEPIDTYISSFYDPVVMFSGKCTVSLSLLLRLMVHIWLLLTNSYVLLGSNCNFNASGNMTLFLYFGTNGANFYHQACQTKECDLSIVNY